MDIFIVFVIFVIIIALVSTRFYVRLYTFDLKTMGDFFRKGNVAMDMLIEELKYLKEQRENAQQKDEK